MKGRLALIEQRGTEYGRGRSHGATFDIHLIREGELILNRIMMDSEVVIALSRGGRGRKFFIGTVCGVEPPWREEGDRGRWLADSSFGKAIE